MRKNPGFEEGLGKLFNQVIVGRRLLTNGRENRFAPQSGANYSAAEGLVAASTFVIVDRAAFSEAFMP